MGIEKEKKMGIVYVLSNPAFERYVKIGFTTQGLKERLQQLDDTSMPLPFRCEFAVEVDDYLETERLTHQAFANVRVRKNREFFEIEAQRVIAALKLSGGKDVTPKEDIAEDAEGIEALERTVAKKQKTYSFEDAHVKIGDVLVYTRDESVSATVVADKKIEFNGQTTSLSKAALSLLHKDGYKWKQANGWAYWMKDGETLRARVERFAPVKDED